MRKPALTLVLLAALAPAAAAGEPPTAAAVTERGRSLERILDSVLAPREPPGPEGRRLHLALDPTASLERAGFAAAVRRALRRNRDRLAGTRISVSSVAADGPPPLPGTGDLDLAAARVAEVVAAPAATIRNVYASVGKATDELEGLPGRREIVLVTLENGDAEGDLEKLAGRLRRAGIRFSAISREAFLSDTYWFRRPGKGLPDARMTGPESAFVEVPFGFVLQRAIATEAVASGFPMFGIARLAQATGGTVHLFYPESDAVKSCVTAAPYFVCPVCSSDHIPCGESYQAHRLRALAPLVGPRSEVGAAIARDPYFGVVLSAWTGAAREGIVTLRPAVRIAGKGLAPEEAKRSHVVLLGDSIAFSAQANRARKMAVACARLARDVERQTELAGAAGGLRRYRAIADLTRTSLLLTRFNLLELAAFCDEVGPAWTEEDPERVAPPEVPALRSDYVYSRITYVSMSLCHGPGPYREMRLPGGEEMSRELQALSDTIEGFLARQASTPFAQVIRRQGIARFYLQGTLKKGLPPPRWVPSARSGGKATAPPARPARAGPSGRSAGGATSGDR